MEKITINQVLGYNKIGGNAGNVLYLMGVLRSILTKDVQIEMDKYMAEGGKYTEEDLARINEECSMYIIPLADAFRTDYRKNLSNLTNFVNQLKIPCHVVGVGVRAQFEPDFSNGFVFDEEVKEFVRAIRKKGSILGLRGEITGEYLKKLGFKEERDFTVIGCPSLYIFGEHLHRRTLRISKEGIISVNFNPNIIDVDDLLYEIISTYTENWYYIAQNISELKCIWLGLSDKKISSKRYCADYNSEIFKEKHIKGFITAGDWIEYMNSVSLSIGGKFHGNVAAILGGAPTIFIPSDARMRELIDYHNLPFISIEKARKCKSIEEFCEQVNFDSHLQNHYSNFRRYVQFLDKLAIPNVYNLQEKANEQLLEVSLPIINIKDTSVDEAVDRWTAYNTLCERKQGNIK